MDTYHLLQITIKKRFLLMQGFQSTCSSI